MEINKNNITAVILAGGKGQRFGGKDKGLISYQGKPLIEHVLERIKPQVGHILINANRNIKTYQKLGYPVIRDELDDYKGPLAGFMSAMKASKTAYIATLPCDGPKLPLDLISRMTEKLISNSQNIAVAHNGDRLQPVYAMIPVTLINSLENYLANGDRKVDRWYDEHKTCLVDFSDQAESFYNVNQQEDL